MGKRLDFNHGEVALISRINQEANKVTIKEHSPIPHYMLGTKSKQTSLEPINQRGTVSTNVNSEGASGNTSPLKTSNVRKSNKTYLPRIDQTPSPPSEIKGNSVKDSNNVSINNAFKVKDNNPTQNFVGEEMSGCAELEFQAAPPKQLDQSVFTFRPNISTASLKIVENLGSDFMTRQQQHIERQKKLLEQSSQHFRLSGQFAPKRELRKEEEDVAEVNNRLEEEELDNQDGAMSPSHNGGLNRTKTQVSGGLERLLNGPLAQNNANLLYRPSGRLRGLGETGVSKNKQSDSSDGDDKENEIAESFTSSRSKTMPTLGRPKVSQTKLSLTSEGERLRNAKELVEKAIKYKKVFTIQGGYATIRHSLRRRGWVEKFYRIPGPAKKTPRSKKRKTSDDDDNDADDDDDDDDDDDGDDTDDDDNDQPRIPPWEEEDGIYGIMSRMVRNINPSFIWVLKRDTIDYRFLNRDQMVNHYCKAGSFTTKVGLCINMRNVSWFDNSNHETFFPRCYRLSHDDDKIAFVDDYRVTACISIVKIAINQNSDGKLAEDSEEKVDEKVDGSAEKEKEACTNPECTRSRPGSTVANKCVCKKPEEPKIKEEETVQKPEAESSNDTNNSSGNPSSTRNPKKKKKRTVIPTRVLETAMYQCERYLACKEHDDIDVPEEAGQLTDSQWDDLLQWYYELAHEDGSFSKVPSNLLGQCENLIRRLSHHWPQMEMDGTRNVWIVKPGAKSRGRGITCYDKLEDMLKLVNCSVVKKDSKYVVQKYMERPLLVYNTKFDIRQWFLVTDWNPLTVWFYQDSYLRFCSQSYSLEDFDQSIHLSNFSIQKHYKNGPRSNKLPADNMWTHETFKEYLAGKNKGNVWDDVIYPGMKRAIICSLLVTQDIVEYRKSSFELYGADFMLTEDYYPWLIEINSSPSMESSTAITARLCKNVLDDTVKVVVDRKFDRNCDIGAFELAYKQPVVTVPPYIGISLCVEGQSVRKPNSFNRQFKPADHGSDSLFVPRQVVMKQTTVNRNLEMKKGQGSNSAGAVYGGGASQHNRKENSKTPDGTTSRSIAGGSHSIPAKVNTFRTPGELTKEKAKLKMTNSGHSVNVEGATSDVDTTEGGMQQNASHGAHNKRMKTTESKKSDSTSTITQSESNTAIPRLGGENQDLKVENGMPSQPQQRVLPNTPYLAGLNQRRYVSKTSVSSNYTIPVPPGGGDRALSKSLAVNNVESTDLQTFKTNLKGGSATISSGNMSSWSNKCCPWCGRGGNLYLDHADPNCRCQKDSVLVTNVCVPSQLPQQSKQADIMMFNNKKASKKLGKVNGSFQGLTCSPRFNNNPSAAANHHRHHHRNAISVTPTHLAHLENISESQAGSTTIGNSNSVTPERPLSSRSDNVKMITQGRHVIINDEKGDDSNHIVSLQAKGKKSQRQANNAATKSYNADSWQILISNQQHHHSEFPKSYKHKHNHPHHQYGNSNSNYETNINDIRSPGFPGSSYYTRRVKNLVARKSAPSSLITMWQNFSPLPSEFSGNTPLAVIAQKRSKGLGKRKY